LIGSPVFSVDLAPETVNAFQDYVRKAEASMAPGGHLLSDARRMEAQRGQIPVESRTGGKSHVPSGLIHDWAGVIFVPGGTAEKVLAVLQDYNNHKNLYQPEVVDSRLVSREGNQFRVFLRLKKKKVLTAVLNTEYDVRYQETAPRQWFMRSVSTRVAEVENAGESGEHELPPGHGYGFLWRLNAYWKIEQVPGGVLVECRSISLSRGVPLVARFVVEPMVTALPRESLASTLRITRDAAAR